MFNEANPLKNYRIDNMTVTEESLTGNQPYTQVLSGKTNWKLNVSSPFDSPVMYQAMKNDNIVTLNPQDIKMFKIVIMSSKVPQVEKGGLPGWAIALIVVGSLAVVGGVGFVVYKIFFKASSATRYVQIDNRQVDIGTNNVE